MWCGTREDKDEEFVCVCVYELLVPPFGSRSYGRESTFWGILGPDFHQGWHLMIKKNRYRTDVECAICDPVLLLECR